MQTAIARSRHAASLGEILRSPTAKSCYALAGLDNRLFVSKYQLELPSTEELTRFLEQQPREVEG